MTRSTASWFIVAGFTLVWLALSVTLIARASLSYEDASSAVGQPTSSGSVQPAIGEETARRAGLDVASSFATAAL